MSELYYYRIQVTGCVSERWLSRYWSMKSKVVQREAETTITEMIGAIPDQKSLLGVINTLYDTGHVLLAVGLLPGEPIEEDSAAQ